LGEKEISINIKEREKSHITFFLLNTTCGEKFPPVNIFKGKAGKNKEKRCKLLDAIKDKRIFIYYKNIG